MRRIKSKILIIGGGPAGINAAAICGVEAVLVDENPSLGGQVWRKQLHKRYPEEAANLIEKIESSKSKVLRGYSAVACPRENSLLVVSGNYSTEIEYEKLIIATGARERFLPFPGWTLPGIFGVGGIQAFAKNGFSFVDKRIIVSGSGPLLLAVADFLTTNGASVPLILEQANRSSLFRFSLGLLQQPKKLFEGFSLKNRIGLTEYKYDSYVTRAIGEKRIEAIEYTSSGTSFTTECDFLANGFHLIGNTELAQLLGCEINDGKVVTNEYCETSIENVYSVGEPNGIGGLEQAIIEGRIAGLCAIGNSSKAKRHFRNRRRAKKFAELLDHTFSLRKELKTLPTDDTIFCRCENLPYGKVKEYDDFRIAKLQTRCGMGSCQGRICNAIGESLLGWEQPSVRPPINPIKIDALCD